MSIQHKKGIITLADKNYFKGLQVLYFSTQEISDIPITCFDIGLTKEQIAWAENTHHIEIAPLPITSDIELIKCHLKGDSLLGKQNKRIWPLWICPFLIAASPYRRTFWIDCDIVILKNLIELFDKLDNGPVFTLENNSPEHTPNNPDLYTFLPIDREQFDIAEPMANGGVSGWDLIRDKEILESYQYPILQACHNKQIEKAISWHDQGALIWAIQKHGLEENVLKSINWNLCAKHTKALNKTYCWDKDVTSQLRKDVPEANLLHWNGQKVPWD